METTILQIQARSRGSFLVRETFWADGFVNRHKWGHNMFLFILKRVPQFEHPIEFLTYTLESKMKICVCSQSKWTFSVLLMNCSGPGYSTATQQFSRMSNEQQMWSWEWCEWHVRSTVLSGVRKKGICIDTIGAPTTEKCALIAVPLQRQSYSSLTQIGVKYLKIWLKPKDQILRKKILLG